MATGRIGVTPTLGVRWSLAPTGGTTALSGLDDNSVSLVYSVGYEQVYRNGVLLSRGNDYTATDGTTVTLTEATITGDIIEIFAQQLVPLADAISKGQFTAKGTLLSATAASTPGVLGVGADGTVLTAASGEATGLEWAAIPAAGANWSLLNAGGTSLSGTTTTISGISGKDKIMMLINGASSANASAQIRVLLNGLTTSIYTHFWSQNAGPTSYASNSLSGNDGVSQARILLAFMSDNADSVYKGGITFSGCNSSGVKQFYYDGACSAGGGVGHTSQSGQGIVDTSATITSISLVSSSGNFDAGTVFVYTSA